MYFKTLNNSTLKVNEDYAHLNSIAENGDLDFTFYYDINQRIAIENSAIKVNVTVYTKITQLKPLLETTQLGAIDTTKIVGNILTRVKDARAAIQQQQQLTIASKVSDITSKISNDTIGDLTNKRSSTRFTKTKLKSVQASELKDSADIKPILTQVAHQFINVDVQNSSSFEEGQKNLMLDMIVRQGVDPSSVVDLMDRSISNADALSGISRKSKQQEYKNNPLTKLLNSQLLPPELSDIPRTTENVSNDSFIDVAQSVYNEIIEVPVSITIPEKNTKTADGKQGVNIFVKFELISSKTGLTIDTTIKQLDVARHVQMFLTPKRAPLVSITTSDIASQVNLEVKQLDKNATQVDVYRKTINRASIEDLQYSIVGSYQLKNVNQSLLIQTDKPSSSTYVYRIIPTNDSGTQCSEFTNCVVRPTSYKEIKTLSLVATPIELGIKLEAQKIPYNVVSIEFVVRNLTAHQKIFTNVGNDIFLIDDSIRNLDYISVIDNNALPGNVYEYAARLIYKSGINEYAGCAVVEAATQTPGKVDTKIKDLLIQSVNDNGIDTVDVTFNIETTIVDTDLDIVKGLLIKQDMYELFKGDVEREREFLKSLIAHNVQRVNLTTGLRENFGTVVNGQFSDLQLRKNQAIIPLNLTHKYRYEVTVLLRASETMFETLVKDRIDPVTKKSYSFKPAKSLHPVTLDRGMIVSFAGLKIRYSKDQLSFGTIGSIETIDVTFDKQQTTITNATAQVFDKFMNVITWKVEGSISNVDHFIIMKEVNGVRSIVGKAHSEFLHGNCTYTHVITRHDVGVYKYVILPIFNDYNVGIPASTNQVSIEKYYTRRSR
jgi:hypothetical protein